MEKPCACAGAAPNIAAPASAAAATVILKMFFIVSLSPFVLS